MLPPELQERFEFRKVLGQGGQGLVVLALQRDLGRDVALKILNGAVGVEKDRFLRESRILAGMKHPGIVQFLFAEADGSRPVLVMEYFEGRTLREEMGSVIPVTRVLDFLDQLAAALDFAHSTGVIHRDLKPENVFVGGDDMVKLADFGLARLFSDRDTVTGSGMVLGTPQYMSPEQIRGETLGPASDLFSLAVIAYELLAGALPWDGTTRKMGDFLRRRLTRGPRRLEEARPDLPRAMSRVLARGLSPEAADRFSTVSELAGTLREACGEARAGIAGAPTRAIPSAMGSAGAATRVVRPVPEGVTSITKLRMLGLGAAVVLLGPALLFRGEAPAPVRASVSPTSSSSAVPSDPLEPIVEAGKVLDRAWVDYDKAIGPLTGAWSKTDMATALDASRRDPMRAAMRSISEHMARAPDLPRDPRWLVWAEQVSSFLDGFSRPMDRLSLIKRRSLVGTLVEDPGLEADTMQALRAPIRREAASLVSQVVALRALLLASRAPPGSPASTCVLWCRGSCDRALFRIGELPGDLKIFELAKVPPEVRNQVLVRGTYLERLHEALASQGPFTYGTPQQKMAGKTAVLGMLDRLASESKTSFDFQVGGLTKDSWAFKAHLLILHQLGPELDQGGEVLGPPGSELAWMMLNRLAGEASWKDLDPLLRRETLWRIRQLLTHLAPPGEKERVLYLLPRKALRREILDQLLAGFVEEGIDPAAAGKSFADLVGVPVPPIRSAGSP